MMVALVVVIARTRSSSSSSSSAASTSGIAGERAATPGDYYRLTVGQRVTVAVVYLGLVAALGAGDVCHARRAHVLMANSARLAAPDLPATARSRCAADVSLIAAEFLAGFQLRRARSTGPRSRSSARARIAGGTPHVRAGAQRPRRAFAEAGFAVVTGGGPGVMEAANRGCKEAGGLSVGFNIALPHEQGLNPWCDLSLTFDHFHVRKVDVREGRRGLRDLPRRLRHAGRAVGGADAPIQTGKIGDFPIVLFDSDYWGEMLEWVRDEMLDDGLISPEDFAGMLRLRRAGGGGRARRLALRRIAFAEGSA